MRNWVDSQLGAFTFDEYWWSKTFELNAFSVFTYCDNGYHNTSINNRCVKLTIDAEDEEDFPTEDIINVARFTVGNHQNLLREGILALYNDMLGIEVDSGLWWHSEIEHIRESAVGIPPDMVSLNTAEDLYAFLGCPSINVTCCAGGYPKPCATINFDAEFDQEHGFGILTDGKSVLGIGRALEIDVFEEDER